MKINYQHSYEDKVQKLYDLKLEKEIFERLFWQARNGAIASLCWTIEKYFDEQGLKVKAKWKEDSRYCYLSTTLVDKYEHVRSHQLDRQVHTLRHDLQISSLTYKLHSICSGEYYSKVKPKIAVKYDEILASSEFKTFLEEQVNTANYPFGYETFSSV